MGLNTTSCLDGLTESAVQLRHELHQIPEIGLDLPQTQHVLLRELEGLPLEITLGKKLSSITAVLRGKADASGPRRSVLLRADMDGLPVVEETGLPWVSMNGAMHACGHDCHMAALVGAVKLLCRRIDEVPGDIVFMFQPGEEGDSGARLMIEEGVLEAPGRRVDAAFGLHVWSGMDYVGTVHCRPGTIMASSDNASITLRGRGGHGSAPQLAADPVPALGELIGALQIMVARQFDIFDPVVLTAGHVSAGTARNAIPETALLEATMRTFSPEAQERLFNLVPQIAQGVAAAHGVCAEVELEHLYPPTINDPTMASLVASAARDLFGPEAFTQMANPMGAAEDFSFILEQVPGAFAILPATPSALEVDQMQGNHSARALYDDSVIVTGSALLVELAMRALAPSSDSVQRRP